MVWNCALAEDNVVNPGTAQHLSAREGYERSYGDGYEPVTAEAEESGYTDHPAPLPTSEKRVHRDDAIVALAGETDWSLHESGCGCDKCGGLEFFGPSPWINTHPPVQMFLSPAADVATVLADGSGFYALDLDVSSIIVRELDSGIIADYDLETWRLTARYHQGLGSGEVFASLPLISRSAGVMDSVIRSWHGMFSLPNALRDTLPDNQFHYVIVTREGPVLNGEEGAGIGDLTVGYKTKLWDKNNGEDAAAVRAMLKLPTGNTELYYGSGALDASLGLLHQRQITPHWRSYLNYDYIFVGDPGLDNIEHQNMGSFMLGTEWAMSRSTTLQGIYQAMVNPLRIGSREADKSTQQLSFGFAHRAGDKLVWTGGFSEDIYPETAPDFVLSTGLKWEF
jgi:hypothetical protein